MPGSIWMHTGVAITAAILAVGCGQSRQSGQSGQDGATSGRVLQPTRSRLVSTEVPEATISRLEFDIADTDGTPLQSFSYSFELYHNTADDPLRGDTAEVNTADGVLRLPAVTPRQGRVRIWIEADDGRDRFRHAYADFSFSLDREPETTTRPTITLESGTIFRGRVVSAKTAEPVAGAEVAATVFGHHFAVAQWDDSVLTDEHGQFRLPVSGIVDGFAARHENYRKKELTLGRAGGPSQTVLLGLEPLLELYGRVLRSDGQPIAGVSVEYGSDSDELGRFTLRVTEAEHNSDENSASFYGSTWKSMSVPLAEFVVGTETDVTLERERRITGRVLRHGEEIEDAIVEVRPLTPPLLQSFRTARRTQDGWEFFLSDYAEAFIVRVTINGIVESERKFKADVSAPIITRLPVGQRMSGQVTPVSRSPEARPGITVALWNKTSIVRRTLVRDDGTWELAGLPKGGYTVQILPPHWPFPGTIGGPESPQSTPTPQTSFWQSTVRLGGADLTLPAVDLERAQLLPGRIRGVALNPERPAEAFAHAFVYLCDTSETWDSVGTSYYLTSTVTDARGRFEFENCPPGHYIVVVSDTHAGYSPSDPTRRITVASGHESTVVLTQRK